MICRESLAVRDREREGGIRSYKGTREYQECILRKEAFPLSRIIGRWTPHTFKNVAQRHKLNITFFNYRLSKRVKHRDSSSSTEAVENFSSLYLGNLVVYSLPDENWNNWTWTNHVIFAIKKCNVVFVRAMWSRANNLKKNLLKLFVFQILITMHFLQNTNSRT